MLNEKAVLESNKRRESAKGYHFYMLYMDCGRKFYLKYINGLTPEIISTPLLFGSAFHEFKAAYWMDGKFDADKGLNEFNKTMLELKESYEKLEDYEADLKKGHRMIDNWLSTYHESNPETYKVIEVEKQYTIKIGPNKDFEFTIRPDVILFHKGFRKKIIMDTKSTGWSLDMVFKSNALNDQITSYIWGVNKIHPEWNIETAQIDCSFGRGNKFESQMGIEVYRSKSDLAIFEMSLYGLILEVSQKYKSLSKYPWPLLFPRNGGNCFKFNKPCEYAKICRMNIPIGKIPPGFKLDEWASLDKDLTKAQEEFKLDEFKI